MVMRIFQVCSLILGLWLGTPASFAPAAETATPGRVSLTWPGEPPAAERSRYGGLPPQLLDVWLRFHETEMCQDTDAVFVFHPKGIEIWCEPGDEKGCQKLVDMFSIFQAAYQIDLYITRPPAARKRVEEKDPPPSLWTNAELLRYLKDPFISGMAAENNAPRRNGESGHNELLKQRLLMYAEQVQEWNLRLKRSGSEIPTLAQVGFGPDVPPELKKRAAAICLAHVHLLDKWASRLTESLEQALPRPGKTSEDKTRAAKSHGSSTPIEIAVSLSAATKALYGRINGFLFPQHHTVELEDLREPGLLESLHSTRELAADFQAAATSIR